MKEFREKLKVVMQELHLSQTQVVGMTGCSKASISQYLSGKNIPTEMKQRDIAVSLGLNEDYFEQDDEEMVFPRKVATADHIEKLLVTDAAKIMGMNHNTVRKGLQQGVFPWGYAIKTSEKWVYFINKARFMKIEVEGAVI